MGLSVNEIKALSQEEIIKLVEAGTLGDPQVIRLDLTTATTNKLLSLSGNYIGVQDASDVTTAIDLGFNRASNTKLTFTKGLAMIIPYKSIFATWTAQVGKYVDLVVYSFAPELFQIIDNRSAQASTETLEDILAQLSGDETAEIEGEQFTLDGTSQEAIASNDDRKGCMLYNPVGNAVVYVRLGGDVTVTDCAFILQSGGTFTIDNYQGALNVLGTTTQKLHVSEW
jgi:hypothetical protein